MSKEIEAQRKSAEIYRGSATCKQKFLELLDEFSVPVSGGGVTDLLKERHVSKLSGVKGKETVVTLPLCEIVVGFPTAGKVKFISAAGLHRVSSISDVQSNYK
ncbi:hypothetical protein SASPL_124170 [Salvia splendens]|uniref:Uncharacterized protein n=1 Tax=Salvia splendens TaxID=180675 RepID=A0A8X8XPK4_SALSN|nr:hypothetical protein SASPL_124170 [Salvia splendens]